MQTAVDKRLTLFSGSHYPELAGKVAKVLNIKLSQTNLERFANGEIKCHLGESVRGGDVFIFQTHNEPVGDAILEQAILIDAAKRASATHITAVCPFLGYSRQDRKSSGREPITAKLVIDILAVAGADRIVSIDLHTGQIQGFFNGPFDHLIGLPALADHLKDKFGKDCIIVSPDAGGVKLADRYAGRLGVDLAIIHKRRIRKNQAEALYVIGDVQGKNCILVDDMIDTAGTICSAAELLKKQGAKSVSAAATHGIFSPQALERLKNSAIDNLAVSDTLPLPKEISAALNVEVVSIVPLLAVAIQAIFEDNSVSAIFDGQNQT